MVVAAPKLAKKCSCSETCPFSLKQPRSIYLHFRESILVSFADVSDWNGPQFRRCPAFLLGFSSARTQIFTRDKFTMDYGLEIFQDHSKSSGWLRMNQPGELFDCGMMLWLFPFLRVTGFRCFLNCAWIRNIDWLHHVNNDYLSYIFMFSVLFLLLYRVL